MESYVKRRSVKDPRSRVFIEDDDVEEAAQSTTRTVPTTPPAIGGGGGGRGGGVLRLLRKLGFPRIVLMDVVYGWLMAMLFVMFVFFLEQHDVINFGYRRAAVAFVKRPENIAAIEEGVDIKLLSLKEYEDITTEITRNADTVRMQTDATSHREKELAKTMAEYNRTAAMYDGLMAEATALFEIDRWCGSCIPRGLTQTCDAKIEYWMRKYGGSRLKGKVDLMEEGHCISPKEKKMPV
ncbi:hypothetical protein ACHAW5_009920 [Stephanodiscus triporus]|uniref:Uncharacterized protein n=1 Tax=Stephanodiscus triporus TaxID=2934178 RepID=A0ABD3QSF8_9STRA